MGHDCCHTEPKRSALLPLTLLAVNTERPTSSCPLSEIRDPSRQHLWRTSESHGHRQVEKLQYRNLNSLKELAAAVQGLRRYWSSNKRKATFLRPPSLSSPLTSR